MKNFLFWTGIPSLIGAIGQCLGYNFVYVAIVSGVIIWGIMTELRIQDLKEKVFGGKNAR